MKTIVHLLRHGEVHNPHQILYGRLSGYPLSDSGRQQALLVAEKLADRDITYVVSSPLQRAQETAAPVAKTHGLSVATDADLTEARNDFEGHRTVGCRSALWQPVHWPKFRNPLAPSWGESYVEIARRMLGAVYQARAHAEGHEAICVSHETPIWVVRRYLEARPLWHDPRKRQCALVSLTSLVFVGATLVDVAYSEPVTEDGRS